MQTWTTGEGIVTPEAVRLQFDEASVGSRGVAVLIDWTAQLAVLATLGLAAGFLAESGEFGLPTWVGVTLVLLGNFAVLFGYPIAFETLARGQTPGKMAMGLRVVTTEGAPVRFRHAAVRAALGLVDFAATAGAAAVIAALVSKRSQRLGDMVAGTLVLRERTGAPPPTAVRFDVPANAEDYAATIDPSGIRPQDYETARAFLLRADRLPDASRHAIGAELARTVAQRLGHTPPAGVSPELFLVCVAARYQQRGGAAVAYRVQRYDPEDGSRPGGGFVSPS